MIPPIFVNATRGLAGWESMEIAVVNFVAHPERPEGAGAWGFFSQIHRHQH